VVEEKAAGNARQGKGEVAFAVRGRIGKVRPAKEGMKREDGGEIKGTGKEEGRERITLLIIKISLGGPKKKKNWGGGRRNQSHFSEGKKKSNLLHSSKEGLISSNNRDMEEGGKGVPKERENNFSKENVSLQEGA